MSLADDNHAGGRGASSPGSRTSPERVETALDQSQFDPQFALGQGSFSGESDGLLEGSDGIQDSRELVPRLSLKACDGVVAMGLSGASECAQPLITIGSDTTSVNWNTASFKELHHIKPVLKLAGEDVASELNLQSPDVYNLTYIKDSDVRAMYIPSSPALERALREPSKGLPSYKELTAYDGVVAMGLSGASECAQPIITIGSDMNSVNWNTASVKELLHIKPVLKLADGDVASELNTQSPNLHSMTCIKDSDVRAMYIPSSPALERALHEPSKGLPSYKELTDAGASDETGIVLRTHSDQNWRRTKYYQKEYRGVDNIPRSDFVLLSEDDVHSFLPHVILSSRHIDLPDPESCSGSGLLSILGFFGFLSLMLFMFLGAKKRRKTVNKRRQEIEEKMKECGTKGFGNLGSTCYLGVTFQSLLSLDCLKPVLDHLDVPGPTTAALIEILYGHAEDIVGSITPFIKSLDSTVYSIDTMKKDTPLRFFSTIMEAIIETEHPSIADLFKTWRQTTKFFDCKHPSPSREKASFYQYLQDLPNKGASVTEEFNNLFRSSKGVDNRQCPVCMEESYSVSWLMVKPATVLVLELHFKKKSSSNCVNFDEILVVDQESVLARDIEEAGNEEIRYQLKSVIQLVRKEAHFIAFVRRMVGGAVMWFQADDEVVKNVKLDDVLKIKCPTLLLYELIS